MLDTRAAAQQGRGSNEEWSEGREKDPDRDLCQAAISMQHSLPTPHDPAFF